MLERSLRHLGSSVCFALAALSLPAQEPAAPPAPPPDRIQLVNGDTLTGTVKSMEEGKITFNSPVLGDLSIALTDVANLVTATPLVLQKSDGEKVEGLVTGIEGGELRLAPTAPGGPIPAPVPLAVLERINPPDVEWTGAANLGISVSTGNVQRRSATAGIEAIRRTEDDRITARGNWIYEDQKIAPGTYDLIDRVLKGSLKYDYFVLEKLYLTGNAAADADYRAGIALRYNAGLGVGYQWFESEDFKLSTDAGVNYLVQEFRPELNATDTETVALRLAYSLAWNITSGLSLLQDVEYLPSVENKDEIVAHGDTRVRLSLIESLFAQFQWLIDYNNTPPPGNERVDNKYLLSLGWEF